MIFIWVDDQSRGNAHGLKYPVELERGAVGHAVVGLAMDDQRRCLEVARIGHRIVALQALGILPRDTAKDFLVEVIADLVAGI
jgi:hypothetical protein